MDDSWNICCQKWGEIKTRGAGLHAFMSMCSHSTVGGLRDRFRNNWAMANCSYLISDKLAKVDSVGKTKQIPL